MAFVIINDLTGGTTSTVRCSQGNSATAVYSTVSGGRSNTSNQEYWNQGYLNQGYYNQGFIY